MIELSIKAFTPSDMELVMDALIAIRNTMVTEQWKAEQKLGAARVGAKETQYGVYGPTDLPVSPETHQIIVVEPTPAVDLMQQVRDFVASDKRGLVAVTQVLGEFAAKRVPDVPGDKLPGFFARVQEVAQGSNA